ncbi:unnamed protein product [Prorocentrum cordatum]|uniref:Uncharacterized protein n=1 Tax=Prorocentrum cordatum TaxID=2364126 RepID=A0ABN9SUT5_9DINO|nr:unnamed protein product [Polarella glacialis]
MKVTLVGQRAPPGQLADDGEGARAAFLRLLAEKWPTLARPTLAERRQLETPPGFLEFVARAGCGRAGLCPSVRDAPREQDRRDQIPVHRQRQPPQERAPAAPALGRAFHGPLRRDEVWGLPARATVHGFVQIGGVWFMVLKAHGCLAAPRGRLAQACIPAT